MRSLNANLARAFTNILILKILVISLIEGLSRRMFFYHFSCHQLKVKYFMFIFFIDLFIMFIFLYVLFFMFMLLLYVWYNSFCFFKHSTFIGLIFAVTLIFAFIEPEFRKVRSSIMLNCSIYRSRKFVCSLCMFIRIFEFLTDSFRMSFSANYLCTWFCNGFIIKSRDYLHSGGPVTNRVWHTHIYYIYERLLSKLRR